MVPDGDVLIHAGDFTEGGTKRESIDFFNWFSSRPHEHKIFIGGNHDFYLEKMTLAERKKTIPENLILLQDSGVSLKGFNFWGSPINPGDGQWAFNRERGRTIRNYWKKIPHNTSVLITHTPPYGIKDQLSDKRHVGCEELKSRIAEIRLPIHIFGHIHNHYGIVTLAPTTFINASCLDNRYRPIHPAVEIEL